MATRRAIVLATAATAVAVPAWSKLNYPDRTIIITAPVAPGGTVDIVARILAEEFQKSMGQPVAVNNKPGEGGAIGTRAAKREQPDGYNILVTANSNHLIVPWVYKNPGFDPLQDFVPIAAVGVVPNLLCVNPTFPANDLEGFLKAVKNHPNEYRYASAGNGTLNHLLGVMLCQMTGLRLVHVPYNSVTSAQSDVIAGKVPMLFASLPSAHETVIAGKLRAIGVSGHHRSRAMPAVPAIAEQVPGFGFTGDLWVAAYVPQGTPHTVVEAIRSAVSTAIASPHVRRRFEGLGIVALNDGPRELAIRQEKEFQVWRNIVKISGAKID